MCGGSSVSSLEQEKNFVGFMTEPKTYGQGMRTVPLPKDEAARLLDLARYNILDTPVEETYDRLTRLVARLLNVPIVMLNFVDQARHWSKATVGTASYDIPRRDSPCAWTILQETPLLVPDLQEDERFQQLPTVQSGIHMYAGTPLRTPHGHHIGTLCVLDTQVRTLDDADLQVLRDIAALAVSELELRRYTQELEHQVEDQQRLLTQLQHDLAHSQTLELITAFDGVSTSPEAMTLQAAELLGPAIAADWTGLVTVRQGQISVQQVHSQPEIAAKLSHLAEDIQQSHHSVTLHSAGLGHNVYIDCYPEHPHALPAAVQAGVQAGAWISLGTWGDQAALLVVLRTMQTAQRSPWRGSDRALLEAAGRSVRSSLARHELFVAATQASRRDVLTDAANRRALEEDLAVFSEGMPLTLALMDLDGFKALNDVAGHAEGDKALRVFAGVVQAEFAGDGQVYRLGGDEFVLVLPTVWTEATLLERIDLAVLALRQMIAVPLGVSVGVATTEDAARDDLLALADARMYQVKRHRKART